MSSSLSSFVATCLLFVSQISRLNRNPKYSRMPFERGFRGGEGFYWVLPIFTGFYLVLPSFTGFYWVLLGLTGFLTSLQGSKGFFCVLLGSLVNFFRFVVIYGVLLGMTWLFVFLWFFDPSITALRRQQWTCSCFITKCNEPAATKRPWPTSCGRASTSNWADTRATLAPLPARAATTKSQSTTPFSWPYIGLLLGFTGVYWVLPGFTEFYRV